MLRLVHLLTLMKKLMAFKRVWFPLREKPTKNTIDEAA